VLVLHCTSMTCATHGCGARGKDCGLGKGFFGKMAETGEQMASAFTAKLGAERDVAGFTPCRIVRDLSVPRTCETSTHTFLT